MESLARLMALLLFGVTLIFGLVFGWMGWLWGISGIRLMGWAVLGSILGWWLAPKMLTIFAQWWTQHKRK